MKTDFTFKTLYEKEEQCSIIFSKNSPFWHLCTNGQNTHIIFAEEDDYDVGLTILAICTCLFPDVKIITFELMSNHIHILLQGPEEQCRLFFEEYKRRLKRFWKKSGKIVNWDNFDATLYPISNLKYLRNTIAYINRNAFLKNPRYTPFTYPWGGGHEFFRIREKEVKSIPFSELTIREKRRLLHTRVCDSTYDKLSLKGSDINIGSFCDIELAESLFTSAQSYMYHLSKHVEQNAEIAELLGDAIFLTDDEIFRCACEYVNKQFNTNINSLSPQQKSDTAIVLKNNYKANDSQIRRILRISPEPKPTMGTKNLT